MKLALVALCVLLACAGTYAAGHAEESCASNYQKCMQHMRELMLDNDAFWFGNSYAKRCPAPVDDSNLACLNPRPGSLSIFPRLLGFDSAGFALDPVTQSELDNLWLANVTYRNLWPMHSYACGHHYNLPGQYNVTIDPLAVTRIPQQQIYEEVPHVTWPATTGNHYLVLIYDVGYSYLHGLYINCNQGNLESCTPVVRYEGPIVADPFPNPFVFLVLEQDGDLDIKNISSTVNQYRADQYSTFDLPKFAAGIKYNTLWAASVMNVAGDLFGAEAIKNYGPVNMCPFFVSQTKFMQQALIDQANLRGMWSTAEDMHFPMDHTPFLPHLEVSVEPVFMTDDIKFESCCGKYSYLRSSLIPNPFSVIPERPVQTRDRPHISLSTINLMNKTAIRDKTYMMMLVDFGDLMASWDGKPKSFMMHWFVSNIKFGEIMYGDELIRYFGPNPFSRDAPRMYAFLLFEQMDMSFDPSSSIQNYADGPCEEWSTSRCKYFIQAMIEDWKLGPIKGVTYFWAVQDDFARLRMYDTWAATSKFRACEGIPGYMEPYCPLSCDEYVADHAHLTTANYASIWITAVLTIAAIFKM